MAAEAGRPAAVPGPVADGPTDRELLQAHVDGDAESFGVLFGRHRDRLWAVALRTTGDPEVAADGLQDGMVAAFRRAASFRGESQVTTWLHRVVVNACLDRLRSSARRRAEELPDDDASQPLAAAADPGDPADHAVGQERRRRVLAALSTLPDEQRAALVLVDMEGYPVAEVAVMLDCAVGTVKSRCHRGRQRLAELLRDLVADVVQDDEAAVTSPTPGNLGPARVVPSQESARPPPRDHDPRPD